MGRTYQRKTQQQSKPKDIDRADINHSPRSVSSGDQGDTTTESHRYSTTEVHTIDPGDRIEQLKKQRLTGRVSQKNGKTKKQAPNERKGGTLRKNAK